MNSFFQFLRIGGGLLAVALLTSCSFFEEEKTADEILVENLNKHMGYTHSADKVFVTEQEAIETGSKEAKYVAESFSKMGYAILLQDADPDMSHGKYFGRNIILFKPGILNNDKALVVGAEYGTKEMAVMLEVAREIKNTQNNHDLYFVAYNYMGDTPKDRLNTGHYEAGVGIKAHAEHLKEKMAGKVMTVILLDRHRGDTENVAFIATPNAKKQAEICISSSKEHYSGITLSYRNYCGSKNAAEYSQFPVIRCINNIPAEDPMMVKYIHALSKMIRNVADVEH